MKKSLCALSVVVALTGSMVWAQAAPLKSQQTHKAPVAVTKTAAAQKPVADSKGIVDTSYSEVNPLQLVANPETWSEKKVSFEGTFNTFSPYALDYKGAMRTSKDYIAFLILRPDVSHHTIPLSELKLIFPRKKVDSVMELESGDSVLVKGKVFSAALGDPWVDVDEVVLLKKSPENLAKAKAGKSKNHDLE